MKRYSMFLGGKNQYCENDCTTKCNLQIQCNPYQITNGFFHRTRTKNFTIHMETQKIPDKQSSLEKDEWSWRKQTSWLQTTTKLQSSRQYGPGTKQKYRPMEQDREPRDKPTHYGYLIFDKEKRICNGAKIASSISGAGKTGQLHAKEWN